jgi:hypothetical protein
VVFLESRFFLGLAGHSPFDGSVINWSILQWLSFVELAVIFVLALVIFLLRNRVQWLSAISVFILMFLSLGLIYEAYSHKYALMSGNKPASQNEVYFDQFHRVSIKRNIIHIVPDQAQGAMLHDILALDYSNYSAVFDGFTLFTQATGHYKGTYPNVVYYMAGHAPEPEHDRVWNQPYTWEYISDTLREHSIVTALAEHGFSTFGFQFHPGIFCKGAYTACTGTHDEVFAGMAVSSPKRRLAYTILSGLDIAMFQLSPIFLRKRIYDDGRWYLRNLAKGPVTHSGVLDYYLGNAVLDDQPGTYNYFHHAGAHAPLLFDRDCNYLGPQAVIQQNQREQVLCTLKQLGELVRTLKQLDVYDQTMIVIHGDHGSPWLPESYPFEPGKPGSESLMGMASTLLLIKPPGRRGPLEFSARQVTIGDIPATIADVFGLHMKFPGESVFSEEPITDRERHYFDYESSSKAHSLQALLNLKRFRIRGDVFDTRNWESPDSRDEVGHPSQLTMDHPDFLAYAQGFSHLEQHSDPVRWVNGTRASVILVPPVTGGAALVFKSYVPPGIEGQWMEVSVQGHPIARLDSRQLEQGLHNIPLEGKLSATDPLKIEFLLGKTMSPGKDRRQLSILFSYIALEPGG